MEEKCIVYLDGRQIGYVKDGVAFVQEVRKARRAGVISGEVNVAYVKKFNEVNINAERGRVRRPYIIVENGASKLTPDIVEKLKKHEIDFNYLVRRGIVEYLDASEEENVNVALYENGIGPNTTHLEVDATSMLGLTANIRAFPEYDQIGRHPSANNFMKQSQGLYAINFNKRYDPRAFVLFYPQKPIVSTAAYRTLKIERHASGQNFIVAMSTYYGYNMKDAIILNKAAIDRGLGRSAFFRTYTDEERRYPGTQRDKFAVPTPTMDGYLGEHAYSKLGEDGIIEEEIPLEEGDVLIGKVSPPRFLEEQTSFGIAEEKRRDNSVTLRAGEEGTVDSVMISETTGATKIAKVRIRSIRVPEAGDKFASTQGQKGVLALIVDQHEMPFSKDGIVPDLLLNPHGIPSRMTFGHLLEMLGAKAGSFSACELDGTAFSSNGRALIDEYGSVLQHHGFDRFGNEVLYDGRTGKRFDADIFTGVVYYSRLWHMTALKLQVRSRGPVQILTHQPTEGKPRRGGLRFGEMERDALVGHGASLLLKERMLDQSDKAELWVCSQCGDIGYFDYIKNVPICLTCGSHDLMMIEICYAFKLLLDEIKTMHILPRIKLKSE